MRCVWLARNDGDLFEDDDEDDDEEGEEEGCGGRAVSF
jgi:hypothetical protein